jgi:prepilin-type N-terminal cleavage/methylation domain-containing protein
MKSPIHNSKAPLDSSRGFTLLEMIIAMAIITTMGAVTFLSLQPVWKNNQVDNAYDQVLMALRNARQAAVNERRVYVVRFSNNNQFTLARMLGGNTGAIDPNGQVTYTLPQGVQFLAMPGIPSVSTQTPDNLAVGGLPIQFDVGVNGGDPLQIFFQPDGSARDSNMNINNGVAYVADGVDLYFSRAISLMGAAGRIRGWRLVEQSGQAIWVQQ